MYLADTAVEAPVVAGADEAAEEAPPAAEEDPPAAPPTHEELSQQVSDVLVAVVSYHSLRSSENRDGLSVVELKSRISILPHSIWPARTWCRDTHSSSSVSNGESDGGSGSTRKAKVVNSTNSR